MIDGLICCLVMVQSQKHPTNKICAISIVSSVVYSSRWTVLETRDIDELFIHSSER